ncbi:MAG: cyclic pyranopterin monophosphate synthase MoaC [Verrucomicrobiota bacterium]
MPEHSFSHFDAQGNATMVGVGHKPLMRRIACAEGFLRCQPGTIIALKDHALPKGDALVVAKIAGIQAAKRTSDAIPLCHTLPLARVELEFHVLEDRIQVISTVETTAATGVEMEALSAVSTAALTLYDMCKAVDKSMRISGITLVSKTKEPFTSAE